MVLLSKALSRTSPKPLQNLSKNLSKSRPQKVEFAYIYSILEQSASLGQGQNLVWHWNGKRRLIVEFRFHWRKRNSQANQTKHGQTYPFIVAQKKGKQTKQSNQTWTNSIIASHPPKCICNFICIQWFVCACQCLPVVASLGSLRSPRSAFDGGTKTSS